jgi:hypothetical protein
MPVESKDEMDALHSPTMTTFTKTSRNSGAGHGEPDEECFKPSRKYKGWLEYETQEKCVTGPEATLGMADINNQILQRMTKFMTDSRLFKTPCYITGKTDIYFWQLYRKEYYSKRSEERICIYNCPIPYRCNCLAKYIVCTGTYYIRLEIHGTHDETSHAKESSKKLMYTQITAIHEAVIVAPNQSVTTLPAIQLAVKSVHDSDGRFLAENFLS